MTKIGVGAFFGSGVYEDKSNWDKGVLYIGGYLIEATDTVAGEYKIRQGTKAVADGAFYCCLDVTGFEIPLSVTAIGAKAFYGCTFSAINFEGTVEQWTQTSKAANWDTGTADYSVVCSDGVITKN